MKITREDILNLTPTRCIIAQCKCGVIYDINGKMPPLSREAISDNLTALMAPICLGCGGRNWIMKYQDNGEYIKDISNIVDISTHK